MSLVPSDQVPITGRPQLQLSWIQHPSLILVPNTSAGLPTPVKDSDDPDSGPPHERDQPAELLMEASYLEISLALATMTAHNPQLHQYLSFLPDSTLLSHSRTSLHPTRFSSLNPNLYQAEQLSLVKSAAFLLSSQTRAELTNAMAHGVAEHMSSHRSEFFHWFAVVNVALAVRLLAFGVGGLRSVPRLMLTLAACKVASKAILISLILILISMAAEEALP